MVNGQVTVKRVSIGVIAGAAIAIITLVGLIYLTPREIHDVSSMARTGAEYAKENKDLPYRVDRLERDVCILQMLPDRVTSLTVKQQTVIENQKEQSAKLDEILRRLPR